ncbi:MAG: DNA polymerase III subunit epsilon [Alphaproteobacteria bacterium]|jgi:DNA polymerase-3 subunit epsilon|nr:DNA polymerase III subunit epsilon [Alphaproteobacteria bacterium]
MREVVLDTETTGLDPAAGHRVVEIGCVELVNHLPTGESLQLYINPEREMPHEAFEVHGLSDGFLADQPKFHEIVETFQDFVGDSRLVIHNAGFDLKFLNAELAALDRPPIAADRAVDTVRLARQKYPGAPASLDALCRRFAIDASARAKHGALLDAELLAEVYLELVGGRQPDLTLDRNVEAAPTTRLETTTRPPRAHAPNAAEVAAHEEFVAAEIPMPIWKRD